MSQIIISHEESRARQARILLTQPLPELQKGPALFLAHAQTLFGAQAVDVALDVEQRGMRLTASSAIGEIAAAFYPRRALAAISAGL